MKAKNDLSIDVLHENFVLRDGKVFWKVGRHKRRLDRPAGTLHPKGYWQIFLRIDGIDYRLYSHRIVYAMCNGVWPPEETDHKNEIKWDNSPSNLRVATHSENKLNRGKQRNNTSGLKWVKRNKAGRKNPWRAAVRKHGTVYEKTGFITKEEAFSWASNVAQQLHGEFYNSG